MHWRQRVAIGFVAGLAVIGGACSSDDSTSDGATDSDGTTARAGQAEAADEQAPSAAPLATQSTAVSTTGAPKELQVAFVYVGRVGEDSWVKTHDEGREAVEEALGDRVDVSFFESVPEGPDSLGLFEELVSDGYDLIFATSPGYGDQVLSVAGTHPNVCFEHAIGSQPAANVGTYFGAAEEARYLTGIAAGSATSSGEVGYVASVPIPRVLRSINAFTLGVRSVNPDATVQVIWTMAWDAPAVEREAAETLFKAGTDVIVQHSQDTPVLGEMAAAVGAKWVGYDDDMSAAAPEAWLTAPVWNWAPYYIRTTESVLDGICPVDQFYGALGDGTVGIAPFGASVDGATRELIMDRQAQIIAGSFNPFTGPVHDQSGTERVAAGVTPPLDDLLEMNYLVEGVIGDLPET